MSCSFGTKTNICGPAPYAPNNVDIIPIEACRKNVSGYLTNLGVSGSRGFGTQNVPSESELILNRAGLYDLRKEDKEKITICPKHRYELTTHFQSLALSCSYPTHRGEVKKLKNPRRVTKEISDEIYKWFKVSVPIGAAFCNTCRKIHSKYRNDLLVKKDELPMSIKQSGCTLNSPSQTLDSESNVMNLTLIRTPLNPDASHEVESRSNVGATASTEIDRTEREQLFSNHELSHVHEGSTFCDTTFDDSVYGNDQEVSFWIDEGQRQQEKRSVLNEALTEISDGKVSPIASTLNSPWEEISRTQKAYYLRKVREAFDTVLSTIAPDQEGEVCEAFKHFLNGNSKSDVGKETKVDEKELSILLAAYNEADTPQTRIQILSLFVNHFSKKELKEMIPGLSKCYIDQARSHVASEGAGKPVIPPNIKRTRLDPVKTDHFVNFISRPNFVQDVAFGTKKLKLDTGEEITIPNVIRTMIPSRIIKQYLSFCRETNFQPASERTLFRIIEVCAASTQKSLQGLDYFSTEGAQAFDTLNDAISVLEENGADSKWARETQRALRECKGYLKTDFKCHIGPNENCKDHCTKYRLSDPKEDAYAKDCTHQHDKACMMCTKLDQTLLSVTKTVTSEKVHLTELQQHSVSFDVKNAVESIKSWKAHLIRTVNQEQAKNDILQYLDDKSILIVMDWAMKYLPKRYREQMSDFYGKRGKSWHVSCVIYKSCDSYEVETIVHIFESCTQDWFAVLSLLENLLTTIKKEHPIVNTAFLKSDNAGCYHNGTLLLSLKSLGERTGITIRRYDYSDPQSGKDVCDRKIAPLKGHIQRWVNENHNVLTAADMKEALESYGGVRGCRFLVAEVDVSKAAQVEKWKGISSLFSFEFESSGIKSWKAYGIGAGKQVTYKDRGQSQQGSTNLQVISPISPMEQSTKPALKQAKTKKSDRDILTCLEEGCVATFHSQKDLQAHVDIGQHVRIMERETVYDLARKRWAENITGVQSSHVGGSAPMKDLADLNQSRKEPGRGWALKTAKKGERATENVKIFLIEAFNKGVKTGNKEDPLKLEKEMRTAKKPDGTLRFRPDERRTAKQISSFFSRVSAAQRKNPASSLLKTMESTDEFDQEDIEAWEAETTAPNIQREVFDEIDLTHPIEYEGINICKLVKENKLAKKCNLSTLKDACAFFDSDISQSQKRKKPYIEFLENLVMSCNCRTPQQYSQ